MAWDRLGQLWKGLGSGGHWLRGWEEAGPGLSFFCLQFDLFASRLFWFSTWKDLGTLSKVQTPTLIPTSSSRALNPVPLHSPTAEHSLQARPASCSNLGISSHSYPRTMCFWAVKSYHGKLAIQKCIFSAKDQRKLFELFQGIAFQFLFLFFFTYCNSIIFPNLHAVSNQKAEKQNMGIRFSLSSGEPNSSIFSQPEFIES